MNVAAVLDSAKDAFYALTASCCRQDALVKLNGRNFKILQLLGEGGFSYVYLAQDTTSGRLFALKKIRCPAGMGDSVKAALKEVEAYKRFRHPNIIRCLDSVVTQSREEDGKIIYLFLPYYKNGTVQNVISAHAVNGTRYAEHQMLSIFHGTCLAVRAMHLHRQSGPSAAAAAAGRGARSSRRAGGAASPAADPSASRTGKSQKRVRASQKGPRMSPGASYPPPAAGATSSSEDPDAGDVLFDQLASDDLLDDDGVEDDLEEDEEEEEEEEEEEDESEGLRTGEDEGQALIGGIEAARTQLREEEATGGLGLGAPAAASTTGLAAAAAEDGAAGGAEGGAQAPGLEPWAHRDIKPANIMLADDNTTPILMDFGSALPARIPVPDRRVALLQQDLAAEHCSMPFRAPELFDVKTGVTLTEAVDIWSLGCTLFAMAYGTSPFETAQQSEHGGSIAMAAMGAQYRFPDEAGAGGGGAGQYSERFKGLVRAMLKVDPGERPTIQQVIEMTEQALERLQ